MDMKSLERRYTMAAILGHSNWGQERPVREKVQNILAFHPRSLETAVNFVSGELFESDEQFQMFFEEAEAWLGRISELTEDEIFEQYPYLGPLMAERETA